MLIIIYFLDKLYIGDFMIKKYVLLFFSAFLLMNLEGAALNSEDEDSSATRERFMPIFRKIVQFQEFLSTPELSTDDIEKTNLSAHSKKEAKKAHQATIDNDINLADQLLEIGEMLIDGKLIADQFFRDTLLKTRLQYLSNRTQWAIDTCQEKKLILPSDPYCFDHMQKFKLKSDNKKFNKIARARNVQRYQFLNLLTSSMFKILRRDELSEETVKLLRVSPQLWPLLKGETHDLGHPDEAGGFAIVSAYLQHPFKKGQGLRHDERRLTALKRVATRINKNVHCPLWETRKPLNDGYLYRTHYPILSLPEVVLPLPYPAFLQSTTHSAEKEEVTFPQEPSFFDTFPFEKFDDAEEEISVPSPLEEKSESIEEPSVFADRSGPSCYSAPPPTFIASSFTSTPSCSTDFIMPSGIRKFHDLIPLSPYADRELDKSDQSFIDKIFDVRGFKNITYGEFKAFWTRQGGKIVGSHGGSHRRLVGPKGDSLSGTYTHGRGQTYTPKTIKYLRAALWYIGCRPSN